MVACVALFAGCASTSPFTKAQIDSADCGTYPSEYQAMTKKWFERNLIDPDSMKIEFDGVPYKGYCYANAVPVGEQFGYGVTVSVNSKNTYGGYTGWKTYVAYLRNGRAIYAFETAPYLGEDYGSYSWVKPLGRLIPKDSKK